MLQKAVTSDAHRGLHKLMPSPFHLAGFQLQAIPQSQPQCVSVATVILAITMLLCVLCTVVIASFGSYHQHQRVMEGIVSHHYL
eukprot:SAG31_NODE_58_length_29669_cov_20.244978_30_plen_84_part_00